MKQLQIKLFYISLIVSMTTHSSFVAMNNTNSDSDYEEDLEIELENESSDLTETSIEKATINLDGNITILLQNNGLFDLCNITKKTFIECKDRSIKTRFTAIKKINSTCFATQGLDNHIYLWKINQDQTSCSVTATIERAHLLDHKLFYRINGSVAIISEIQESGSHKVKGTLQWNNLRSCSLFALTNEQVAVITPFNCINIFKRFEQNVYECINGPLIPTTRGELNFRKSKPITTQNYSLTLFSDKYLCIHDTVNHTIELWQKEYLSKSKFRDESNLFSFSHLVTFKEGKSLIHLRNSTFILDTGTKIIAVDVSGDTTEILKSFEDSTDKHNHSHLVALNETQFAYLHNNKLLVHHFNN